MVTACSPDDHILLPPPCPQVNRRIISRLARRATIAIPVLGFYFVSKLLVKDYARVRSEAAAGNNVVAGLFATGGARLHWRHVHAHPPTV